MGKLYIIFIILYAFISNIDAQTIDWESIDWYLGGDNVRDLDEDDEYIYGCYKGGIFTINKLTNELNIIKYENYDISYEGITEIEIDVDGKIWIVNYDKGFFYNYNNVWVPKDFPGAHKVNTFLIDKSGNKWYSKYSDHSGISKINYELDQYVHYDTLKTGEKINFISSLEEDRLGNIWAGGISCLYKFDYDGWISYPLPDSLPTADIRDIAIEDDHTLWLATLKGIVKFDGENFEYFNNDKIGIPSNNITSIAIDSFGNKWFGTRRYGLSFFNDEYCVNYNSSNCDITSNFINIIFIDNNNNKWVGTEEGGINQFDNESWKQYIYNQYPTGRYFNQITFDEAGNLWAAANERFYKYDGNNWYQYKAYSIDFLSSPSINSIIPGGYDGAWIGTGQFGLQFFFENQFLLIYNNLPLRSYERIHSVAKDYEDILWFSTDYSVYKLEGNDWIEHHLPDSGYFCFSEIKFDQQNNLWVKTPKHLGKYDGNNWTFWNSGNSPLPESEFTALEIDEDGVVWIGTKDGGLIAFNGLNWTILNTDNSLLAGDNILSLTAEAGKGIWIGINDEGLTHFDGSDWRTFRQITTNNGNEYLQDILSIAIEPSTDYKWLATNYGIKIFKDLRAVSVDNKNHKEVPNKFALSHNYPNPFNPNTEISFALPYAGEVFLTVNDLLGREVANLANGYMHAGTHTVTFKGDGLPSGVYVYRLNVDGKFIQAKKMVLLK